MRLLKYFLLCGLMSSLIPTQIWANTTDGMDHVCAESADGESNGDDCNSNCTCPDDYVCNSSGGCTGGSGEIEVVGSADDSAESGNTNSSDTTDTSSTNYPSGGGSSSDSTTGSPDSFGDDTNYSEFCADYGDARTDCQAYNLCMIKAESSGITSDEEDRCGEIACDYYAFKLFQMGGLRNGDGLHVNVSHVTLLQLDYYSSLEASRAIMKYETCTSYFSAYTNN